MHFNPSFDESRFVETVVVLRRAVEERGWNPGIEGESVYGSMETYSCGVLIHGLGCPLAAACLRLQLEEEILPALGLKQAFPRVQVFKNGSDYTILVSEESSGTEDRDLLSCA